MGEYIDCNGEHIKLGTCENLYYATYDELKYMVENGARQLPGNLPPHEYLDPSVCWRYRFPFPNDDRDDFDKGVIITAPAGWEMGDHDTVCLSLHARDGSHGINVFVPCPLSKDAKPETYSHTTGPTAPILEIVQQRIVDGHLWTVVRCPYCQQRWRLSPDEAARLVAHIRQDYHEKYCTSSSYYLTIADRIEEGYLQPVELWAGYVKPAEIAAA
jgi:hypothetical protein